ADTFAVIVAGAGSEVAEPLHKYLDAAQAPGPIPILGTGMTAAPETAALVNGPFGHALDYDDVLSIMPAHPSAVIVAALLASIHGKRVDGRAFIEAYLVGVEVGGNIGIGMTNGHYQRGFHATGTLALFSGLAALAKLHKLDVAAIQQAFGIASSMSSGLRRNFGTMTKPLHTGIAARSALTAFNLAASGFSAAPDVLEAKAGFFSSYGVAESSVDITVKGLGKPYIIVDPGLAAKAGFFSSYGVAESSVDITVKGLGKPYIIVDPGLALKKFPCCYASHRAIDGLLALRGKLACDATNVAKVICRMPPGGMHVLTYPRPVTGLEGKFSLHYPLAAALLDGKCALATFTDEYVQRKEIATLYERIDAAENPACRGDDPLFETRSSGSKGFVEVEIHLSNGKSETMRVDKAPGSPTRELAWNVLHEKFIDCARHSQHIGESRAGQAFDMIQKLENIKDIAEVTRLLC
ncbi:MAG: MmgE/PrpD family protein, partial [Proteobacteria bacterium]|nr:MmgE/PrpD family protein [Pseudomonadota bacterium]